MAQNKNDSLFFTQLKVLLWKNLTLKRRSLGFLILEILWPLVLFIIIVAVRNSRPAIDKPACHLQPKALPSAGFLPFLQTLFCTFENRCFDYPPDSAEELPPLEQLITSTSTLLGDDRFVDNVNWLIDSGVEPLLLPGGLFDPTAVNQLSPDTQDALLGSRLDLGYFLTDVTTDDFTQLLALAGLLNGDINLCGGEGGTLPQYITLPSDADRTLVSQEVCSLSNAQTEELLSPVNDVVTNLTSADGLTKLSELFSAITDSNIIQATQDLAPLVSDFVSISGQLANNDFSGLTGLLSSFACGTDSVLLLALGASSADEREDQLADMGINLNPEEYRYDNDSSHFCNNKVFRQFQKSIVLSNVWKYAQPILVGKILYAPQNNATDTIIKQLNTTFEEIERAIDALDQITEARDEIFKQLYDYFEDPNSNDLPLLTVLVDLAPAFVDFSLLNETADDFFSNNPENPDVVTWQTLFNETFDLLKYLDELSSCFLLDRFVGFDSESEMEDYVTPILDLNKIWAGFAFTNVVGDEVPSLIKYKIRMKSGRVDDTEWIIDDVWFPDPRTDPIRSLKPLLSGQLYLTDLLEKAIIDLHASPGYIKAGSWVKQFPSPCYKQDEFLYAISGTIPLFMTLAWLFSVGIIVKGIVYEKETRLKEVMKMMGLGNTIHWVSWFITSFLVLLCAAIALAIILKLGNVLTNSSVTLVAFVFLSYVIPTITFCFLVSVFFSRANLASAVAGLLFFVVYLPYVLYQAWQEDITGNALKFLLCLSSNVAFGFACTYFAYFEQQGSGAQWSNVMDSPIYGDDFSMGNVLFMMYFDAVIYLLIALYIEQVKPGTFGVPRKWYFLFQKSFWDSSADRPQSNDGLHFDPNFRPTGDKMEPEPGKLPIGVQVRDLTKVYSVGNKVAVNNLSLNFYENQITSFLGHNGAGKTTTLSILTGLFPPTSGTAFISGLDIRTDMNLIRKNIGMCPQYNVLFDRLTVSEHLKFYGRLRGKSYDRIEKMTTKLLTDLNLPHKSDALCKNLSGGMKRKLSVAISFIGDNKTVILDEPTAGVDPHSRRGIWELLTKYKIGRTILLSTHHMDEADVLGDRIAIISNGQLQCSGSPLFLRRKYGNGYQLTLVREAEKTKNLNEKNAQPSSSYDPGIDGPYDEIASTSSALFDRNSEKMISKFIKDIFPEAILAKNIGTELTYTLPYSGLNSGCYTNLFKILDSKKKQLGISDYGLSDSSLEDIFIEVATQAPEITLSENVVPKKRFGRLSAMPFFNDSKRATKDAENEEVDTSANSKVFFDNSGFQDSDAESDSNSTTGGKVVMLKDTNRQAAVDFASQNIPKVSGNKLKWLQFQALYIKRFQHIRKDRKAFFSQILLPALFVLLAMIFTLIIPTRGNQPSLELNPYMYGDDLYMFYSDSSGKTFSEDDSISQLLKIPHHSTRCLDNYSVKGHPCERASASKNFTKQIKPSYLDNYKYSPECDCSTGYPVCEAFAGGAIPAEKKLATTEILQDLTGRNISDYLVKTRLDFKSRRFYGFEFEGENNDYDLNEGQIVRAVLTTEDLIRDNPFFQFNYTSGLNWTDVMAELNSILNDSVADRHVKIWWNNKGHHMLLSANNALNNLLLREALPASKDMANYGIVAYSHPWKKSERQLADDILIQSGRDLIVGICVIFALSFVPASFVLYLIAERVSKAKHLQYVSGVNPTIFWVSTFLWDLTNYLIPVTICIFIFICFQTKSYVSADNFPALCLLLFLYGFAVTPLMYPSSYLFNIPSTAYVLLTGVNAFIGINCTVATYILDFFPDDEGLQNVNNALKTVFMMFPQYCLGRGLFEMALNQLTADVLGEFGRYEFKSPLTYNIAGKHIFALFLQGVIFFTCLLIAEHIYVLRRFLIRWCCTGSKSQDRVEGEENSEDFTVSNPEEDVQQEEKDVISGAYDNDPVVLKHLRKEYRAGVRGRKLVAVKNLCFHVSNGECFGLLGVNGAGKTSTFDMMTGDSVPTSGNATLAGFDVVTHLNDSRKRLGFCPQFDALDPLLSTKEHIMLYARLRGISSQSIAQVSEGVIVKMGLKKYRDKQAGTLSGGNKRKLSTAIALVGNPQIIFLDEPTSGMDPAARRYLWQCIHDAVNEGRTVVLTSHSMEECEALCTRLAIMVNGEFKCIGSTQHIKTKYGNGYIIHIKTKPSVCEMLQSYFFNSFPDAEILELLPTLVVFQVPQESSSLSKMFHVMQHGKNIATETAEGTKEKLIEDFSISQSTLDQVFINFASEQHDDEAMDHSRVRKFQPIKAFKKANANLHQSLAGPAYSTFTMSGTGMDDALLDNISLASGDSTPSSAASLKHVAIRPGSAQSVRSERSEPTPLDEPEVDLEQYSIRPSSSQSHRSDRSEPTPLDDPEVRAEPPLISFTPTPSVSNMPLYDDNDAGVSSEKTNVMNVSNVVFASNPTFVGKTRQPDLTHSGEEPVAYDSAPPFLPKHLPALVTASSAVSPAEAGENKMFDRRGVGLYSGVESESDDEEGNNSGAVPGDIEQGLQLSEDIEETR